MPLDFRAPRVSVGQVVLWSYGPNEKPSPAIVTAVGQGTVNCLCHVDSVKDHVGKTGVRHKDDPFVKAHPAHDAGVWQLTPRDEAIDAMLQGPPVGPPPPFHALGVNHGAKLPPGGLAADLDLDGEDD